MNWLDFIKWDDKGLVPVIAQEHTSGDVLMFAWMNREALQKTAELKRAVYFSRSRGKLWFKGEEATETVMAAKDMDHGGDASKLVSEVADLWFHSMIALAHYGLTPAHVVNELARREGLSGLEEKALRKVQERERLGE